MYLQIVGKVRLAVAPPVNHFWSSALRVTGRGLATGPCFDGGGWFEIDVDLVGHNVHVRRSDGRERVVPLVGRAVADFHAEMMAVLDSLGIPIRIRERPVEVPRPVPFTEDRIHATYDAEAANRFFRALLCAHSVFEEFRAFFVGKASPVHFFWGSFDLALTLFNGRRTDARAHADPITREAYSHECISFGFWPGTPDVADASFYSYTFPEPEGYSRAALAPMGARYDDQLKEYVLPYESVRTAPNPALHLLDFLRSAYAAGADLARWDRDALERHDVPPPDAPSLPVDEERPSIH